MAEKGTKINVLDHGYVQLVDWMGDDKRIVDAARISYGVEKEEFDSKDRVLLRYLMKHWHWSPFEQVQFTFRMSMPIFVARQMVRHRTAKLNEVSGRYTEMNDEFYVPNVDRLQKQAANNKQGSASELIECPEQIRTDLKAEAEGAFQCYDNYLATGMAKELARINLPLSTYTQWYFTIDLRNLFNLLRLRLDSHAQYEIRVYAEAMYELIKSVVPVSLEAFDDYIMQAETFSRLEMKTLKFWITCMTDKGRSQLVDSFKNHPDKPTSREVEDFLRKLGIE